MEKRFQRIGTMSPQTAAGCPLEIREVSLWLDTENRVLFMSPVIENRYSDEMTEFSIGYEATDREGTVLETEHGYRIDDFDHIQPGQVFGEDMPITLQEEKVVGGKFFVEEAVFADGYIWQSEEVISDSESETEDPNVTTVETIGGFGPEGAIFRKVPLSKVIAQRLTTQFVTTVIAIALCVFTLAQNIGIAMKSDKEMIDMLVSSKETTDMLITALEGTEEDGQSEEEYRKTLEQNDVASFARSVYIAGAVMLGASILYSLYLVFYLRETRHNLRENTVTDPVLTKIVKRLKTLSIIEVLVYFLCAFSFFGVFAGISGISTASMHKRIMKAKNNKQAEITK